MDKGDNVVVIKAEMSESAEVWYAGYKETEDHLPDGDRTKKWFPASVVSELPSYCDAHLNDLWGMLVSITLLFGHEWLYETFLGRERNPKEIPYITLLKNDYEGIKGGIKVHMESLGYPEIVDEILRLTLDTPKTSGLEDFDKGWLEIMDKNVSRLNVMIKIRR
jgi:hypothetical protein